MKIDQKLDTIIDELSQHQEDGIPFFTTQGSLAEMAQKMLALENKLTSMSKLMGASKITLGYVVKGKTLNLTVFMDVPIIDLPEDELRQNLRSTFTHGHQ